MVLHSLEHSLEVLQMVSIICTYQKVIIQVSHNMGNTLQDDVCQLLEDCWGRQLLADVPLPQYKHGAT